MDKCFVMHPLDGAVFDKSYEDVCARLALTLNKALIHCHLSLPRIRKRFGVPS